MVNRKTDRQGVNIKKKTLWISVQIVIHCLLMKNLPATILNHAVHKHTGLHDPGPEFIAGTIYSLVL